jgi:hypothetical protein
MLFLGLSKKGDEKMKNYKKEIYLEIWFDADSSPYQDGHRWCVSLCDPDEIRVLSTHTTIEAATEAALAMAAAKGLPVYKNDGFGILTPV